MELDILGTTLLPSDVTNMNLLFHLFRSYMELDILETTLLPSDVTKIKFYRPPNFKFLSG
jgi:dual oxidase